MLMVLDKYHTWGEINIMLMGRDKYLLTRGDRYHAYGGEINIMLIGTT